MIAKEQDKDLTLRLAAAMQIETYRLTTRFKKEIICCKQAGRMREGGRESSERVGRRDFLHKFPDMRFGLGRRSAWQSEPLI